MTYYQFIRAVENKVKEGFENGTDVCTHAVLKNNGTIRQGIIFREKDINISPTIYLEEYYQRMLEGDTLEDIAKDIVRIYGNVRFREPLDTDFVRDYSQVKSRIVYRLINRASNEKLLEEVPYVEYLDLAIVYYLIFEVTEYGMASMMIRHSHIEQWKIATSELHQTACDNTHRIFPYEFMSMNAAIESLTGMDVSEEEEVLYILSNHLKSYGAAALLYPGRLEGIGIYMEDNYYVLPSSVHEVILIAEKDAPERERLGVTVREINETQLEEEDILSDHIYYYDRATKNLQIVV